MIRFNWTSTAGAVLVAGSLALTSFSTSRHCRAELPPAAAANVEPSAEAREQFGIGVSLLQDPDGARYEEAFQAFLRAYTATPSWKILGNLGLSALKIERYTDGIEAYERYLAQAGEQLDPAERDQVKRDLSIMKATSGTVTLKVTGASSVVVEDTRVRSVGGPVANSYAVPASGVLTLQLAAGHHQLKASGEGKTATLELDVASGQKQAQSLDLAAAANGPAPSAPSSGTPAPASAPASAPPPSGSSGMRTAGLVIGGIGIAGLIGGGVMAVVGSSAKSDLEKRCPDKTCAYTSESERQSFESDRDALKTKGTITTALFIGGGVLAAGGAALFVLSGPSKETRVSALPCLGPGLVGLSAQGAF